MKTITAFLSDMANDAKAGIKSPATWWFFAAAVIAILVAIL